MKYTQEMISEYVEKALQKAHYEIIEDAEPFYGEVAELQGVWATGKTLEECRTNLASTIEGWLLIRISRYLSIPELGGVTIATPKEVKRTTVNPPHQARKSEST